MSKLNKLPKMCNDRGRAYAWYKGKRHYFGVAGSEEASRNYNRFINELTKEPVLSLSNTSPPGAVTNAVFIAQLCDAFLKHAKKTKNPGDYRSYVTACKALLRYAALTTAEFDAFLLLQIQEGFVKAGYARDYCNKLVNFVIGIFRWGEPRRLVPPGKSGQLRTVEPLRYGQAQRESRER